MIFVLHCSDHDKSCRDKRLDLEQAHDGWVQNLGEKLMLCGPLLGNESRAAVGSLYLIEADSAMQAHELIQSNPFYAAGIWRCVTCNELEECAGKFIELK